MAKPFKLDGEGGVARVRDVVGRFAREDAIPTNPLEDVKPAKNDQQTMSGWAPGIGKNSATIRQQHIPQPKVAVPNKPFKE